MSIVKISEEVHDIARASAKVFNRSINMQVEYWVKIGMMIEANPDMTYHDVWQRLMEEAGAN